MPSGKTKSQHIYWVLKKIAISLPPGDPFPGTIRGLAEKYAVNHKTVESAVKRLKREGILLARPKVGLKVSPHRPAADEAGSYILFLTSWHPPTPETMAIVNGAASAAKQYRACVRMAAAKNIRDVLPLAAEGLAPCAIVSYFYPDKALDLATEQLRDLGVRICTVDEIRPGLDAVIFNNRAVGRLLGRFLFTPASHRQVVIFRRYTYAYPEYEREEGLREIMTEMQVPHTRVQWLSHCGWPGTPKLVDRLTDFFSGGMRIDAVYLNAPHLKEDIVEATRRAAVAPPLIASVGSQEELQKQGMAGVAFRFEELGERAVELVMARLNNPSAPLRMVQLEGKLYVPDNASQR